MLNITIAPIRPWDILEHFKFHYHKLYYSDGINVLTASWNSEIKTFFGDWNCHDINFHKWAEKDPNQ